MISLLPPGILVFMKDTIVMTKKEGENPSSLYRRFVKHFRASGTQMATRRNKFYARRPSKTTRKKDCMTHLAKRAKFEEAYRLGKISALQKK